MTESPAHHLKPMRQFFLLCMMMFCTDDPCSMSMYTLITDIVDSPGDSALLVRILNCLGVCVSAANISLPWSKLCNNLHCLITFSLH